MDIFPIFFLSAILIMEKKGKKFPVFFFYYFY